MVICNPKVRFNNIGLCFSCNECCRPYPFCSFPFFVSFAENKTLSNYTKSLISNVRKMKKQQFTETQIATAIKQYEGGRQALDVCREYGISKATLYNWRKKYSGMDSSHLRELKTLQDENRRLKQMYAELSLDYQLAKSVIEKKL